MSLINKMLQDLEARSSDNAAGAAGYGQVRAVADRSNTHPARWIAIGSVLALVAVFIGSWPWLRQSPALMKPESVVVANVPPQPQPAPLSLKIAPDMPGAANAVAEIDIAKVSNDIPAPVVVAAGAKPELKSTQAAELLAPIRAPEPAPSAARVAQNATPAAVVSSPAPAPIRVLASASAVVPAKSEPPVSPSSMTPAAKLVESATPTTLTKQVKELTAQQRAENEYRRASTLMQQQARTPEAIAALEQAIQLDPQHVAARQTLVGLLMENKRPEDAIRKLQEGLTLDPGQQGFAMILARLQVEKGELKSAVDTLQRTLPYAAERDDYQAFLAALLQRQSRHKEAIEHYQLVLRHAPQNGLWWMGLAISLQAENRLAEAQDAYSHAKMSNTLSPELHAFVEQKLVLLQR